MTSELAWQVGAGVAGLAAFIWFWRRFRISPLAGTVHDPPPDPPWEEELGGDGPHRYGRAQSFNTALAEQDARARAGELDTRA